MQSITTSKGKTFDVEYAFAPTYDGAFTARFHDGRRLPEIAADFDGLATIVLHNGEESCTFDGYTRLISVMRMDNSVVVKMVKEAADDAI